jgi:hypothetical protein
VSKTTRNLGGIALIKPILDGIAVKDIVDRFCPMKRNRGITNGEAVEVMIMNRLTSPTPLLRVEDWANAYALEEACEIAPSEVNDDRLGRALDSISPCIEEIEAAISMKIMSKYRIRPELVHFDAGLLPNSLCVLKYWYSHPVGTL